MAVVISPVSLCCLFLCYAVSPESSSSCESGEPSSEALDKAPREESRPAVPLQRPFVPAVLPFLVHKHNVTFLQFDLGLALRRVWDDSAIPLETKPQRSAQTAVKPVPDGSSLGPCVRQTLLGQTFDWFYIGLSPHLHGCSPECEGCVSRQVGCQEGNHPPRNPTEGTLVVPQGDTCKPPLTTEVLSRFLVLTCKARPRSQPCFQAPFPQSANDVSVLAAARNSASRQPALGKKREAGFLLPSCTQCLAGSSGVAPEPPASSQPVQDKLQDMGSFYLLKNCLHVESETIILPLPPCLLVNQKS